MLKGESEKLRIVKERQYFKTDLKRINVKVKETIQNIS